MKPTLHILTNPSGIVDPKYRMEPFNIAALKFIENMTDRGWNIVHYGHESAVVNCESEICVTNQEFPPPSDNDMLLHQPRLMSIYNERATKHIQRRKKPGDMILCFYGLANKPTADAHRDLTVIEPSIGYPADTVYAPYRAFVSYAQMHYFYGVNKMLLTPSWFDAVIPNSFTPEEFKYSDKKDDYFVYLGRVNFDKGVDLCIQVTKFLGKKLKIAGPAENLQHLGYDRVPDHVELLGYVNAEQRADVLSRAECLMAPTHYIEPFGNIVAEAQFCGTPVLTTDWGGYVDSVDPGKTGFRCRDFGSFIQAARQIHTIKSEDCRSWAEANFSDAVIHDKFDQWLEKIHRNDFYYTYPETI
jgi:glycosyltransferase involved in cell wall biosynthesis